MNRRRLLIAALPLTLFVSLAGLFLWGLERNNPDELKSALINRPAPVTRLPGLDGGRGLTSADLATGKPVLVNLFASWCAPCKAELPVLIDLGRRHGVTIHAIVYKDDPADTQAMLAALGNPFTRLGVDRSGRAALDWGIYGVPETFIVDGKGVIRYRHVGDIRPETVTNVILPVLKRLEAGQ